MPSSAVDGNPLVGSSCVRGPATGDFFGLLYIVLLTDVIYSFVIQAVRIGAPVAVGHGVTVRVPAE